MSTTNITSGSDFIGKTLIIGATALANRSSFNSTNDDHVFFFNSNSNDPNINRTYMFLSEGGPDLARSFAYKFAGDEYPTYLDSGMAYVPPSASYSYVNILYVISFVSNTQLKYNIYRYGYDGNTPYIGSLEDDFFLTLTIPNTFLSSLTYFSLGQPFGQLGQGHNSIISAPYSYVNNFYNGRYDKVALYNGDLFALSQADIESTLLTVITTTRANIINNNTYTFRSLGSNFLGVVVNLFNYNTTTGYTVSNTNITLNGIGNTTLNGNGTTTGGYFKIIGSYIEAPGAPTNVSATATNAQATINWTAPNYSGGSAITSYSVTSSPGNFQATTANGSTTTATISGLTNGTAYTFTVVATNVAGSSAASAASTPVTPTIALVTSNILASIYYATAISSEKYIFIDSQNIELSGNVIIKDGLNISNGLLTTNSVLPNITNSASLGSTSKIWSNAYISDVSVTNIELSGNIVPLNANSSSLGSSVKHWSNAYINDVSVSNIELSGNIVPLNANSSILGSAIKPWSNAYISDISATNIELSGNMVPLNANSSMLGSNVKQWSNAYINDISVSNIELSGNIVPLNANKSNLGSALKPWSNAYINDVSVSNIELSGNMVPLNANSSSLGSALKQWSNAYINDVSVTNIELSGNIVPLNANSSNLGSALKPWSNAYIRELSATNIELSGKLNIAGATKLANSLEISGNVTFGGSTLYVPASFTIDPIGHGNNTGTLTVNGNLIVQGETTTINSSVVDISDKMIVLASNASNAIQANGAGFEISGAKVNFLYNNSSSTFNSSIGISISGNVLSFANGSIGEASKVWNNAYISDVSATNIELSGNIVPLNANSSRLGSSLKPWSNAYISDVSASTIELSGNMVPLNANSSILGSSLKHWSNAYIREEIATNIELSGNIDPINAKKTNL
jgi:hypothetical protein